MSYQAHSKTSPLAFAFLLAIAFVNLAQAQLSVPFEPRLPGGNIKVKGDLVFVANNIVSTSKTPNLPVNDLGVNNDGIPMNYIDIDGDPSTFSSSSAKLNAPSCSAVVYAGLYWGGIYKETTNRGEAYKSVKLKVLGGEYVEIGPNGDPRLQYERIYDMDGDRDEDGWTDPGIIDVDKLNGQDMTSYMNYANVTHLLSGLADPNGEYTVADVVASVGTKNVSAGWTMVVIYQNMNSTSKYISTFDGYAAMDKATGATIPVSGFRTLPGTLPVNATIGASAMDGDRSTGPHLQFRAKPTDTWTSLKDAINPYNNVFNSTISHLGSWVDTRNPASRNTTGWDADVLKLDNPLNKVLPNDHDSGEIKIYTSNEGVYLFLATLAVEIITPEIIVEKKVWDVNGNDITGDGVHLGQTLQYVLRFRNRGNDDATNFSIRDILPENVSLENVDLTGAPGTIMITDPLDPREVTFNVPDNLVTQGGTPYEIRIRVDVSNNCHDFVAACSTSIDNTAYFTYQGQTTGQLITDDPSVSHVNSCGIVTPGATNFLMDDLSECSFESEVQICGDSAQLTAGEGYDSYTWYRDLNENGQVDATDTLYDVSDPDNDPRTVTVQQTGHYLVVKESASCGTNKEIIRVSRFGTTQSNPILNFFNLRNGDTDLTNNIQGEVATCPNDGSPLPKLFLCGTNDSQEIILGITDTRSIIWEKLVEGSCTPTGTDCPNNQMNCDWAPVGSGNSFIADKEGRYRVTLAYTGGCNSIFYFDVFQNNLDFEVDTQDIFCDTDGFIRVKDVPSGYGFQLVDTQSGSVVVPYSANNGPDFPLGDSGVYRVDFTQMDPNSGEPVLGSCVFSSGEIWIQDRELDLTLTASPVSCKDQGSVRVQANGVRGNYHYRLHVDNGSGGPGALQGENLSNGSNDIKFEGLTQGSYVVVVTTDDGCSVTETFEIEEIPDPLVSAATTKHISCNDGEVTLSASRGFPNPSYSYAIWSKDGTTPYSDTNDIPTAEFQRDTNGVFTFAPGEEGTYTFVVMDGNNCWSISNEITVNNLGPLVPATPTIDSQIVCEGSNTGQISMNVSGAQGPYTYSMDNWASSQKGPTFVNLSPGKYTLRVRSQDGCEEEVTVTLDDPETLGASAGISSTGTCDSDGNSEVRFTNVGGGTAPYEFSFDGGSSFSTDGPTARISLLPSGNHILMVKDARGCTVTLPINIDPPLPFPNFTRGVDYDCDGNGIVSLAPDQSIYDYQYSINTLPVTTSTNGNYKGIAPGSYTITATYTENDPPNPSILLHEDFGSGPTVDSKFTQGYTYEDQLGSGPQINDFEYTVTSRIAHRFGNWLQPVDHTSGGTDDKGRYLVINVGSPSPGQVIYKKPVRDIIANQPMRVSFAAMNLLDGPNGQLDPDLWVQMRIPGTTTPAGIVGEVQTGDITRNYQWNTYEFTLNPGTHTELDFELVSRKIGNDGNDVAIDDILVEQVPQSCPRTVSIPIVIEAGNAFGADILSHTDTSCQGATDGTIRFEVENFDPVHGFEYSIDGGTIWTISTVSPVTTAKAFGPGMQRVTVRKVGDTACSIDLDQEIEEPVALAITTDIERGPTCTDLNNGSITAAVTGGSPTYQYALEDGSGTIIVDFPNPSGATFNGLAAGEYVILARDINGCSVSSDPINLSPPVDIDFEVSATACYDGTNSATITLNVNTGNGGYRFHLDGGIGEMPIAPATDTYTFTGLSNGSYSVNVTDAFGCSGDVKTITIDPQLVVNTSTIHVSCSDGGIEVSASGGQGTLVYAVVPDGDIPNATDFDFFETFSIDNAMALANPSGFDLYVRDNNGATPYCEYIQENIIVNPKVELELEINPIDPNCNGGNGSIEANILKLGGTSLDPSEISQTGPYTYSLHQEGTELKSVSNLGVVSHTFNNLPAGIYEVRVTDGFGCVMLDDHIHITDPPVLTAEVKTEFSSIGDCAPAIGFSFVEYTTGMKGDIEFGYDNGNWQSDPDFTGAVAHGMTSGDYIYPSIRTVDDDGNTLCRYDLPRFTLSYPLDDLDITINATVDLCQELLVSVQGSEGDPDYVYTYTNDPLNFDPATALWTNPPKGEFDPHIFTGLIPGRTYVFYVKDNAGCVRQSSVNVNDLDTVDLPIQITETVKPSCDGMDNGSITFTLNPDTHYPKMRWDLFEVGNTTAVRSSGIIAFDPLIFVDGLPPNDYYLEVTQVDASDVDQCHAGSENFQVREQLPITATVAQGDDIGCVRPGTIVVTNINGGTGPYTFDVTDPDGATIISGTTQNPIEIPANSPAGDYEIFITDVYSCKSTSLGPVTMNLTPTPKIVDIQVDNCDGNMEVTVDGSSLAGGLRYAMVANGAPAPTAFLDNLGVFKGVAAGQYDFYVMDANGCSIFQTLTVHPTLDVNVKRTKLLDCTASPNATIEINVDNGSGNYEYSVREILTDNWLISLTPLTLNTVNVHPTIAGTYEVKVIDLAADHTACERVFTIKIPEAIHPEFTATPVDISCFGANDGSIILTQTDNGITPLSYELLDASLDPVDPSTYSLDPLTRTFSGLAVGDYVIRATGNNVCSDDSDLITIGEPDEIFLAIPSGDVVQFGCALGNNSDNASITVSPSSISGGTGYFVRFEFVDPSGTELQDGKNSTLIISDFTVGSYTINVYDDSGCMVSTTVAIDPFDQLLAPKILVDDAISCANSGETITILAHGSLSDSSNALHNYSFEKIDTGTTNTDGNFSGLQVGIHAFRVTNTVTGCSITVTHEVEPIQEFLINLIQDLPVVCAGDLGQNHFEILGGYNGYFEWNVYDAKGSLADTSDDTPIGVPGSGNGTFSGNIALPKGTFRIAVEQLDFPYCTAETMVTIGGSDTSLDATITELGNASCSNDRGRLSVVPSGGTAPYTLEIPALGQVQHNVYSHVFTDLVDGIHSIQITDAAGCATTVSGAVLRVDPLTATLSPASQTLECIGDADGSISATLASGGVGTVLYSLNRVENGTVVSTSTTQTSAIFGNLKAGTYSINVQDDAGCTAITNEVVIEDPAPVHGSLTLTRALTCGTAAQLTLSVDGGTPYPETVYQWSVSPSGPFTDMNGGNNHVFDVVPDPVPYQYYVRDAHGCEPMASNAVRVNTLAPLQVEVDLSGAQINCNGDGTAFLSAKATGGLGNYVYGLYQDAAMTVPLETNNSQGYFSGLFQGTYYLGVDSGDCQWTSTPLVISEPPALVVASQITDVSCTDAADGSIVLDVTGGTTNYQFAISPYLNKFDGQGTFTDLSAGDYSVIVQDAKGCFEVLNFTIAQPNVLEAEITLADEICHGSSDGAVHINVTGGTAPYSSSLNSNADGDFNIEVMDYANLPSGDHVVFIRDANGCTTNQFFTVGSGANLAGNVEMAYGCTGNMPTNQLLLTMEDPSVVPDLMYSLDSNDPNDLVLEADFGNLAPGNHSLTIAHVNGCSRNINFVVEGYQPLTLQLSNPGINQIGVEAFGGNPEYSYRLNDGPLTGDTTFLIRRTDTYDVTVTDRNGCSITQQISMEYIDIEIPNFFTPDGDGLNDTWKPRNIEVFPKITISVFDRYGRNVYKMLQDTQGWDGFYNESNLPVGDYWYIIKLNGDEDTREFVGHFTLYR